MARVKQTATKKTKPSRIAYQQGRRKPLQTYSQSTTQHISLIPPRINNILPTANQNTGVQPINRPPAATKSSRFENYSIPRRTFQKICREIALKKKPNCRFTVGALEALQTAAEDFMVGFFEDAALCMVHAKRKTLMKKDLELVVKLRKMDYEPL